MFTDRMTGGRRCILAFCAVAVLCCWAAASLAAAKTTANPSEKTPDDWQTLTNDGAQVVYRKIRPAYAKALLAIAREARAVYANTYGFDMPDTVILRVELDAASRTNLWTDGESRIFLTLQTIADLAPSPLSGVYNIYGICHELGHMAMYRKVKPLGMPPGVAQGWAHYAGSVVVDEIYKKLGDNAWPINYNFSEDEGIARLKEQAADPAASQDPETRAAVVFYQVQRRCGAAKVFAAMKNVLSTKPAGKDLMPKFVDELVKSTGDESIRHFFPDDMLTPVVQWDVAEREISDKTFEGQSCTEEGGGVLLRYDDGSSDGKLSTAGSGHAVVFRAPQGSWAADYVEIYGSRYGTDEPPNENFTIYFCDRDFNVLKEIAKPYSTFEKGNPRWYRLDFDPVKAPNVFYVCVWFNPTATKGVYMHYDSSVGRSHSRSALPYSHVSDVKSKFDWMIRVHLKPAADQHSGGQ